ncbi:cystathionine gamma-synthase [Brevibacterium sp. 5221]|uniref:homocysteine desulfhydrase n=2 Tax=Brevibacteriaceae TaxID=85019 RepID=A0A6N9H5G3_9MICO|nr:MULTISPECIES: PLP-dependent aspartate aminotransferase family protein [Brevibacterium]MYM19081.1 cystathionine gamma-synthase [Brevibacterium rongguiense]WAL40082.1 PLP-dependent aspartate aminotransferase family protein [Brevibacterium sp. BRM-1]
MSERSLAPETIVVDAGRPPREPNAAVSPDIELSATFVATGVPGPDDRTYGRSHNSTWEAFEGALARLEGAQLPGLVFGSGMAAITAAQELLAPGGTLVAPRHSYMGTLSGALTAQQLGRLRLVTVDIADTDAVRAALTAAAADGSGRDETGRARLMLWVETPTNPMLEVADLPAIIAAAQEAGALVVADNTFATPLLQRPLEFGADVVVHSATKYISGHSDVILGIAVTSDPALRELMLAHRAQAGGIAGPFEVWLALRGLRTLALRVERAGDNAMELATRLTDVAGIAVRYPGLPDDPGNARAGAQMTGYGAIIALELPDAATADAVVDAVELFTPATSLGSVESLIERRRRNADEQASVPEGLLRLSIGIESVEDLWADLSAALRAALAD